MWLTFAALALAFETGSNDHLEVKWVRDSGEYQALTRQVFRGATASVAGQASDLSRRAPWAVVVDIDETLLDNSPYWLELGTYDQAFTWASWDAWCERRSADAVPGAVAFIAAVRDLGGRVAFVSNRHARTQGATRDNLRSRGLWQDGDRLCLLTDDDAYTKRVRREQVRSGAAPCGWSGEPVHVLAYLGDTLSDLPEADEDGGREAQLGARTFVLPNPMYGGWEHGVTRSDLTVPTAAP